LPPCSSSPNPPRKRCTRWPIHLLLEASSGPWCQEADRNSLLEKKERETEMERTYKRTQFSNPSMLRGSDEEIWFRSRNIREMRRRWVPDWPG
jgi:hypothetical protein